MLNETIRKRKSLRNNWNKRFFIRNERLFFIGFFFPNDIEPVLWKLIDLFSSQTFIIIVSCCFIRCWRFIFKFHWPNKYRMLFFKEISRLCVIQGFFCFIEKYRLRHRNDLVINYLININGFEYFWIIVLHLKFLILTFKFINIFFW